ncbi:MAG: flagellar biosynthesis protein FlhF [Solirubrobacteraceae bacterium]|jgi:flagellar biosynthesis GTPase FlhF|nr:flagellar biosynthesis protein FlhF [Solirubrobacteraceae bacterium]
MTVTDLEPRTYRGTDLEELLPKIREELGPDAIVLRQRDGLDGGIGGFFQRRCVEVVARRAAPRVNHYDEGGPVMPPLPEPPAPAIQEIMRVASPFVEQLQAAEAHAEPKFAPQDPAVDTSWPEPWPEHEPVAHEPEPEPARDEPAPPTVRAAHAPPAARAPAPRAPAPVAARASVAPRASAPEPPARSGAAATHEAALVTAGIAPKLAAEIVCGTLLHAVPFAPKRALKHLVRDAFAARIPILPPGPRGAQAIAFVGAGGAGKTLCATRVAAAYEARGDLGVTLLKLATGQVPERVTGGGITVVDTPAVSPAAEADTRALARQLRRLGACEVHVAVPATLSASAVRRLLDGLAPLKPAAIALTHLDEVDHAGPVIDEAIARGIALSFCGDADTIVLADPSALAARVLG